MNGYILLAGGSEFSGLMAEPDLRALQLAGGQEANVCILPTAAVPDESYHQVGNTALKWFRTLGASSIEALPLIDRASANDAELADRIREANLIYLPGGFMGYLVRTLRESACWQAALEAYEKGAVIAGSAAGAMVLCEYFYEPATRRIVKGLGLLPNTCVLPHHDLFGHGWIERLYEALPGVVVLGIDERTALIDDGEGGRKQEWTIYGQGSVTRYRHGVPTVYTMGERLCDSFREQV